MYLGNNKSICGVRKVYTRSERSADICINTFNPKATFRVCPHLYSQLMYVYDFVWNDKNE